MRRNGYVLEADQNGKTMIITGASSGIGKAAAIILAKKGANIILACRSEQKTLPIVEEIRKLTGREESASFWELDLGSLESVRVFAKKYLESDLPLHVLINNAALSAISKATKDGFEAHFQVNYLSHHLLTMLLLPKLKASAPSRIVNVSSAMAQSTGALRWSEWTDPNAESTNIFQQLGFYGNSKFLQIASTIKLAEELKGTGVNVYALHPGVIPENRNIPFILGWLIKLFLTTSSDEEGATTTVFCATSPDLDNVSGTYYDECILKEPNTLLKDPNIVNEVYTKSAELLKL